jgi:uncharacterized membrane protein
VRTLGLWALGLSVGLWVAALFVSPLAVASSNRVLSFGAAAVYAAGSQICHQRPERSFHIGGRQMPVCARCTGLYVSAAAAVPIALLIAVSWPSRRARIVFVLAALPTVLTWSLEYLGLAHFSNLARAVCAVPLGFVAAWLVVNQIAPRPSRPAPRGTMR